MAYNQCANTILRNEKVIFELKIDNKRKAIGKFQEITKISEEDLIEMIDISNTNGRHQVGVVVAFKNFIPDKSLYRKYSLDAGNNDYKNIYDVTYRHFRRKLLENKKIPNLYIVDGKNQINSAKKALDELRIDNVKVIGLVKNKQHDTDSIIDSDGKITKIPIRSELYLLLGSLQDEVHRFAINYHRVKKTKEIMKG